jgi:hypothetical protein
VSGRLRTHRVVISVTTAIAAMVIAPAAASAGPVEDLVNQVSNGVDQTLGNLLGGGGAGGGGGSAATPAPRGATPQAYVPPAHGTNPHAQGTGAVVDLTPDDARPLPYDEGGDDEEVVVGASRGEQNPDGSYHGHVTILTLLGNELIEGADTNEGETSDGPLGDVNALLEDICTNSSGLLCLAVLDVHSETTAQGSENSFSVLRAGVGIEETPILDARAVESEGNISDDGTCQTSESSSDLADASVLPGAVTVVGVDAADSSSESQACNDGTSSQTNDSSAFPATETEILGNEIELPIGQPECGDGTPNSPAAILGIIDLGVCNADDSSNTGGTQNDSPFGVREGLTVLPGLLGIDLSGLVKVTTTASESQAVAPPATEEPPPGGGNPPGGNNNNPSGNEPEGPNQCPDADNPDCPPQGGPFGPTAEGNNDQLPFTGADMVSLGLIGLLVMGTGLGLMAIADRRRRSASPQV